MSNKLTEININELIFSLDIGTRTVIGLVGVYEDGKFKILASEIEEHEDRYMHDGQIHDISGVASVVKRVKEKLEEKLSIKLEKVAIAAAGRALKTQRIKIIREIDITMEINKRIIESLEMECIQKAQDELDKSLEGNEVKYYCVGYTVVNYFLNEDYIDSLEGHRGNNIGADVVATFLPHVVVDSLYTVMSRVGLEVINMTLEPIAAINVAIKKSLRLLNLALVDIGAGTSDIAITKDGTIIDYAMASVAGDEITEHIAKKYLLDYDTAERLKVELVKNDIHTFYDVVGISHELKTEEILDNIDDSIRELAKEISDRIIEYNQKAPSAVFMIGGGSQTPRLSKYIAKNLELAEERVVIRKANIIENIEGIEESLKGPEAITPIGIAITAISNKYEDFLEVVVNGQKVKLLNSKQIKVSDALTLVGYNPRNLIPQKGEDFVYYLNGKEKTIKATLGEAAKIYVNGMLKNLECKLNNGDEVKVIKASRGQVMRPKLYDIVNISKKVLFDGQDINLIRMITVNGEEIKSNVYINKEDGIRVKEYKNILDLLKHFDMLGDKIKIFKNNNIVDKKEIIEDGDIITVQNIIEEKKDLQTINLKINGEDKVFEYDKDEFVFIDIFNYIDIDLSKPKGTLILNVNGQKARYYQKLNNGDVIDVYWQQSKLESN